MKFNIKKNNLILIIFSWSVLSSPLSDGGGEIVTPLILNFNPSLITVNKGASAGTKLLLDYDKLKIDLSIGYTNRINNSGFSILYNNFKDNKINEIIAAFGTRSLNFNFGTDFKFIIKNGKIDFTFDVAANYLFSNKLYAGLLVNNILRLENIDFSKEFEVDIFSGGKIPKIKEFYYDLKLGLLLFNEYSDLGYRGYLSLKKYFFENPNLILFASSDILYDENKNIVPEIDAAIGSKIKLKKLSLNIYCGTIVNIESLKNILYSELSFDTKRKSIKNRLNCNIYVDKDENSNIIITTKGLFKTEKTSLKRWTVFIYSKTLNKENILKTFSGGNIPPSSIIWDKRDSSGKLVDNGEYYVKIVLIDNQNRTFQSNQDIIDISY